MQQFDLFHPAPIIYGHKAATGSQLRWVWAQKQAGNVSNLPRKPSSLIDGPHMGHPPSNSPIRLHVKQILHRIISEQRSSSSLYRSDSPCGGGGVRVHRRSLESRKVIHLRISQLRSTDASIYYGVAIRKWVKECPFS